jgi:predicted aspartyl protease
MIMYMRIIPCVLLLLLLLLHPVPCRAEFYSYEDKSGTMHFVDDLAKIPQEYRQQKQVRKDKYDDLPEEERAALLAQERLERDAKRKMEDVAQAQARRSRQTAEELARQRKAYSSPVFISGRQVFVPVKLKNGSAETEAMLLLDTGATSSVITPEVAARLNIGETYNVRVSVVGGRVLNAKKLVISEMLAGPVRREKQEVVIIRQRQGTMGDGLLGMSFLAGLKYTIDFENQRIIWMP